LEFTTKLEGPLVDKWIGMFLWGGWYEFPRVTGVGHSLLDWIVLYLYIINGT
jgi:hypothetical protein